MYRKEWENIPPELRERNQWCYTDPNTPAAERKAPRRRGGYKADKTNPEHWMTFDEASFTASQVGGDVGYCLTKDDPFTCIDLDVKNKKTHPDKPWLWTTPIDLNRHWKIVQVFNSYTEKSQSGNGLHVWLYGDIGEGAHHGATELYIQEAFIICTGNPVVMKPIQDGGENLATLYLEIRQQQNAIMGYEASEIDHEPDSDFEVLMRGMTAENREKFNMLCSLSVEDASKHYTSNSEADLALLSMFAFYTKSNSQVKRLFRYAPLAEREKSTINDVYLNRTIKGIRKRFADKDARISFIDASVENILAENTRRIKAEQQERSNTPIHVVTGYDPIPELPPESKLSEMTSIPLPEGLEEQSSIPLPPGNMGILASWIASTAARPNMEIAICSALAFYAGIVGRKWNVNGTGLNLYIVLVGKSGIGKEHLHTSISKICRIVRSSTHIIDSFYDSTEYRSAQAMSKAVLSRSSYLHLFNEWGRRLKMMGDDKNHGAQEMRTMMTVLYHKSGQDSTVGGMSYSDSEKNVAGATAVAYSMVGETTPETFYGAISGSMMEDGFMGRFIHIETKAERPPLNREMHIPFPVQLEGSIADLAEFSAQDGPTIDITRSDSAAKMFHDFELECDAKINENPEDEVMRQLFNRASVKAMRVAAVLAASTSHVAPVITAEQADWAINLIRRDIKNVQDRIDSGDLGHGDMNRLKKIKQAFKFAVENKATQGSVVSKVMLAEGIVPLRLLRTICASAASFKDKNMGVSALLDRGIDALISSGEIIEVPKATLLKEYTFTGRAFQLNHED